MIAFLDGKIVYRNDSTIVLNVNGVGYKVMVANNVLVKYKVGERISLHIYTHVREDTLELFGFIDPEDLYLFEMLISVSGVGCKSAINIFNLGDRETILKAIANNDIHFFSGVPRLGNKNAQKIIIELKNKVINSDMNNDFVSNITVGDKEIIEALRSFGFSNTEVLTALRAVKEKGETIEEKIRLALKYLGK